MDNRRLTIPVNAFQEFPYGLTQMLYCVPKRALCDRIEMFELEARVNRRCDRVLWRFQRTGILPQHVVIWQSLLQTFVDQCC